MAVLIGTGLDDSVTAQVQALAPNAQLILVQTTGEAIRRLQDPSANATGPDEGAAARRAATEAGLTQREHEVLIALADGQTPAHIARDLDIALSTARSHAKQLREMLGCTSMLHTVITGARRGLVPGVTWSGS